MEDKYWNDDRKKGEKIEERSSWTTDETLYEQIFNPTFMKPEYIIANKNGKIYRSGVSFIGWMYKPIDDEMLSKGLVTLPEGIEEYESEEILINEIKTHIKKYLDIDDDFLHYSVYYILLSWVYDKLTTIPYLRALGDWGTGKSRFIEVIGKLCYKPMKISGAATPAPIYRIIEKWKGTLIVEEADRKDSDEASEVTKILNCGFEKGNPVVRCDTDNHNDVETHEVYGPKVISSRQRFFDKALESRCLTYTMQETRREDIPPILPPSYYEEQKLLRKKLLMFRMKNWWKMDLNVLEDPSKFGLVGLEPRLKQVVTPFLVLFTNEKLRSEFITFMQRIQIEMIEERADSLEGQIVEAIKALKADQENITPTDVANYINEGVRDKDKINNRVIGRHIKSMKIKVVPIWEDKKTMKVIKMDDSLWQLLLKRYDVETYKTILTNLTSLSSHTSPSFSSIDIIDRGNVGNVSDERNVMNYTLTDEKIDDKESKIEIEEFFPTSDKKKDPKKDDLSGDDKNV